MACQQVVGSPAGSGGGGGGTPPSPPQFFPTALTLEERSTGLILPAIACWWVGPGSLCRCQGDRSVLLPKCLQAVLSAVEALPRRVLGGHHAISAQRTRGTFCHVLWGRGLRLSRCPGVRRVSRASPRSWKGQPAAHTVTLCPHPGRCQPSSPVGAGLRGDSPGTALASSVLWAPASPAPGGSDPAATAAHACLKTPLAGRTSSLFFSSSFISCD